MLVGPAMPGWETGVIDFHAHGFSPSAEFTEAPRGFPEGHRHKLRRNKAGRVVGFEEAEGHEHPLPDWVLKAEDPTLRTLGEDSDIKRYAMMGMGKMADRLMDAAAMDDPDEMLKMAKRVAGEMRAAAKSAPKEQADMLLSMADKMNDMEGMGKQEMMRAMKGMAGKLRGMEGKDNAQHEDEEDDEEEDQELYSIRDVEIFKVGTWNGDEYSKADLDNMIANFNRVGFQVPVKLGHKEISGGPAYGWVSAIRRVGNKLVADLKDLPKKLWQAIRDHRFDSVSSEVFWDLERNGKKFKRVLKAIALLGSETPAVSDLAPLRTVVNNLGPPEAGYDRITVYSFALEGEEDMTKIAELEAQVAELSGQLDKANAALKKADDAVKAATGTEKDKATAELKSAQDAVKKLETDLKTAQDQIKGLAESQAGEIADLKKQVEALTGSMGKMAEERRKDQIKRLVAEVPIPAFRRYFEVLYEVATTTGKVVKYSQKDGKTADASLEHVLKEFVAELKSGSRHIFQDLTSGGQDREEGSDPYDVIEDPSAELDKLTKKFMDEHKDIKYGEAAKRVLANPDNANLAAAWKRHGSRPTRH